MQNLKIRKANKNDIMKYFEWVNDQNVRVSSYNSELITWQRHQKWFIEKINDPKFCFYILQNSENQSIGQVRFEQISENNSLISVSIAPEFRGFGYGQKILKMTTSVFLKNNPGNKIHAYIKVNNISSKKIFEKAGFIFNEIVLYKNFSSYHFIL